MHKILLWLGTGIIIIGALVFAYLSTGVSDELNALRENAENLRAEREKVQSRLDASLVEFDKDEYKEEIDVKTVNAKKIGEKIITIQNELADLFRVDGNLSKKFIQDRVKRGPELGVKQAEISDISPDFYYNSWKLNKDWDLTLESVISYQNVNSFPVVFMMTTTKGEPAGLIKATYDVREDKLLNVERHYTVMGELEEVQGVGD